MQVDTSCPLLGRQPHQGQRIVDAARGASDETKDEIFEDLNTKWATGRAAVGR